MRLSISGTNSFSATAAISKDFRYLGEGVAKAVMVDFDSEPEKPYVEFGLLIDMVGPERWV